MPKVLIFEEKLVFTVLGNRIASARLDVKSFYSEFRHNYSILIRLVSKLWFLPGHSVFITASELGPSSYAIRSELPYLPTYLLWTVISPKANE